MSNIVLVTKSHLSCWQTVDLAGTEVCFKIDTGAEASLISRKQWDLISKKPHLYKSHSILKMIDGTLLEHIGKASL